MGVLVCAFFFILDTYISCSWDMRRITIPNGAGWGRGARRAFIVTWDDDVSQPQ